MKSSEYSIKLLKVLIEAGQLLNSTLKLDKILSILLELAVKNLKASRGTIYLLDQNKKELWSQVLKGDKRIEIRLPLGKGIAGTVAKTGKTINLKDVYKDKRFHKGVDEESGFISKTMLCAPMKDKCGNIIGVFQILNKRKGWFTKNDEQFLTSLSLPASLAIENARLHLAEIENQRMEKELEVAAQIQKQLLPDKLPKIENIQLSAATIPCRSVGGDFYDIMKFDNNKLALVIADVAGKGIPGALLVSTLQASLHTYLELGLPPQDLVAKLNNIVYKNSTPEKFITFFFCLYDVESSKLEYVNAGHNYPIVVKQNNEIIELKKGGFCLGLLPDVKYESEKTELTHGDVLVLYTDGITEAVNTKREFYNETRLYSLIKSLIQKDISIIQNTIIEDVKIFSNNLPLVDDLTLVLMKKEE